MNLGGSVRLNPCGVAVITLLAAALIYLNWPWSSSWSGPSPHHASSSDEEVSMKSLLSVAIEAAKRGGREVKRIREEV